MSTYHCARKLNAHCTQPHTQSICFSALVRDRKENQTRAHCLINIIFISCLSRVSFAGNFPPAHNSRRKFIIFGWEKSSPLSLYWPRQHTKTVYKYCAKIWYAAGSFRVSREIFPKRIKHNIINL